MNIKAYRIDLDRALLQGPDALLAHMREYRLPEPSCRDMLEVTMHKAITASRTLPMQVRAASKSWLLQRGYHALDDGDIWWT